MARCGIEAGFSRMLPGNKAVGIRKAVGIHSIRAAGTDGPNRIGPNPRATVCEREPAERKALP